MAIQFYNVPNINENILLHGFFQSEKYFSEYKTEIYSMFKMDYETNVYLTNKYNNLENKYFIHVRRGDYLETTLQYVNLDNYYKNCLNMLPNDSKFLIISDDIDYCKKLEIFKGDNFEFVEYENELNSLYLMSLCRMGGIAANSSFSWWGGYLNENTNKTVFFPNKWVNADWDVEIGFNGCKIVSIDTQKVTLFDYIDKIVYINLDKRSDRNKEMNDEFTRVNIPKNKIIRFNAIENNEGAIGCSLSHIEVIKMAKENNWSNILVLEDDFNFIDDIDFVNDVGIYFFNSFKENWDIINLSRGYYQDFTNINDKYILKVNDISTTSAYLVNNIFYDKLLNNFKKGCDKLILDPKNHETYAIDRYWKHLMSSSKWYIFNQSLGYQRSGYSSIGKMFVNYIEYDKTLVFGKVEYDKSLNFVKYYKNPITIVTCFYNLDKKSKHSNDKYYKWISNFLNKPMNIIIFLDKDDIYTYNYIMNCRKHFFNKTYIISQKMEEWNTYKYIDYWNYCHSIDSEKDIHSIELYMLWNEKTYFLKKASKLNPFNSDWFFWTDIGCCRNDNDKDKFMTFPNYNKIINYDKNKIILSLINPMHDIYYTLNSNGIPSLLDNITYNRSCNIINLVQAGFFGGHINGLKDWFEIYDSILELFINNKIFGGKEQNLMTAALILYKEKMQTISPVYRGIDIWFDFLISFS